MIVSDVGQAKVFLINIAFGIICVALLDLFKVIKRRAVKGNAALNVLDGAYFVLIFALMLYAQVKFNLGALRYYQVFALFIGMILQKLVFSKLLQKILEKLMTLMCKMGGGMVIVLWKPISLILRCIFSVFGFFEEKTIKICHKLKVKAKKLKIKNKKKKKTVKKRFKMI